MKREMSRRAFLFVIASEAAGGLAQQRARVHSQSPQERIPSSPVEQKSVPFHEQILKEAASRLRTGLEYERTFSTSELEMLAVEVGNQKLPHSMTADIEMRSPEITIYDQNASLTGIAHMNRPFSADIDIAGIVRSDKSGSITMRLALKPNEDNWFWENDAIDFAMDYYNFEERKNLAEDNPKKTVLDYLEEKLEPHGVIPTDISFVLRPGTLHITLKGHGIKNNPTPQPAITQTS